MQVLLMQFQVGFSLGKKNLNVFFFCSWFNEKQVELYKNVLLCVLPRCLKLSVETSHFRSFVFVKLPAHASSAFLI